MKTAHDPRHSHRVETVKTLFAFAFDANQTRGLAQILPLLPEIDAKISQFAKERPLEQVNKLDLAILRLGVFELVYKKEKPAIVIDEAIEIAKEFGGDSSSKFVNAILGKIAESYESTTT